MNVQKPQNTLEWWLLQWQQIESSLSNTKNFAQQLNYKSCNFHQSLKMHKTQLNFQHNPSKPTKFNWLLNSNLQIQLKKKKFNLVSIWRRNDICVNVDSRLTQTHMHTHSQPKHNQMQILISQQKITNRIICFQKTALFINFKSKLIIILHLKKKYHKEDHLDE